MTLLADAGVSTGVMSQGGKVWQDKKKLGAVLASGMSLRRKFAVYSLVASIPILYYLLHKQGASWLTSTMLVLSLMPAFFTALSGPLLETTAKLHQSVSSLQTIQVMSNGLRLALTGILVFIFPIAATAIIATGGSQIFSNWRLRILSVKFAERVKTADSAVTQEILEVVKRILPGAIYYCLSGQITIWLIVFFGSTKNVAEVGALGRLAMVSLLLNVIISTLVIPRFARLRPQRPLILKRFIQTELFVVLAGCTMVCGAYLFQDALLSILGPAYSKLNKELMLVAIASSVQLIVSSTVGVSCSRGQFIKPSLNISFSLLTLLLLTSICGFANTFDVLVFNLLNTCAQAFLWLLYFYHVAGK